MTKITFAKAIEGSRHFLQGILKMTNKKWMVAAGAIIIILALGEPAVTQELERLTGHGTVLVTVSSGGATTDGVRMNVDFRLSLDRSGEYTGEFKAEAAGETPAVVVIDGVTYGLVQISAGPPFQVNTEGRRFTSSSTNGLVTVSAPSGRTRVEGALRFEGEEGGAGTPFSFSFDVGDRGEQGVINVVGTWESGPGVKFISGQVLPLDPRRLLSGLYSGEFHGVITDIFNTNEFEFGGILVIGFDGLGGVTGGRMVVRNDGPFSIDPGTSFYELDGDGFGRLVVRFVGDPEPGLSFTIAVFDGGKGAKIGLRLRFGQNLVSQLFGNNATGEIRKQ